MRQAQRDFWNNPTGVIRNRNPAPFWFTRRSNPSLRQSPPISFNLSKNAWLPAAKILVYSLTDKHFPNASLATRQLYLIFIFLTAKVELHTATYLRNQKKLPKKRKKSCTTQIGCAENVIFASNNGFKCKE